MRDAAANRLVTITRTLDAPRELVFRMWSKPELLTRWYAPRRCRLEVLQFDFREGGEFRYRHSRARWQRLPLLGDLHGDRGARAHRLHDVLLQTSRAASSPRKSVGADADWPDRTTVTVTFVEKDGRTTMTLHQTVPESVAKRTGAYPSWLEMLERLVSARGHTR